MSLVSPKYSSDQIQSLGFDEETGTLVIRFHKGGVYEYSGVSEEMYGQLLGTHSPGSFFRQNIKGKFATRKLP